MSLCTVAANKTVKQDASVQLPTSHVLPYATLNWLKYAVRMD